MELGSDLTEPHLEGYSRTQVHGEQKSSLVYAFPSKVQVKTGDLFAGTFTKPLSCGTNQNSA